MSPARRSPTWSKAKLPRKFARPSTSKTTSLPPKKNRCERRTSGAKKSNLVKKPILLQILLPVKKRCFQWQYLEFSLLCFLFNKNGNFSVSNLFGVFLSLFFSSHTSLAIIRTNWGALMFIFEYTNRFVQCNLRIENGSKYWRLFWLFDKLRNWIKK